MCKDYLKLNSEINDKLNHNKLSNTSLFLLDFLVDDHVVGARGLQDLAVRMVAGDR